MARFECFSRTQRPDMDLLPIATEALQSQGFKVRSAIGESLSLVESQPVKRLRDRAVVLLDQHTNPDGQRELQCVISNDSISSSPDCRCHGVFRQLLGQFEAMPDVVVEAAAA